ncbi:unnamed protein product [Prorocentrum cordatum]|uniref:Ion transport domain-containing protein n=1 Tax=Prorocentrum cordatum TaxID=2364126 RepID=A0ABN9UN38_9DINO|nr:unnamed protein product [Polarella glacialis]
MLVHSIVFAGRTVFWALVLLLMIVYAFGVVLTLAVMEHTDGGKRIDDEALIAYYGDLYRSMLSLWMAVSGGISWIEVALPLQRIGSPVWMVVFLLYVIFVYVFVLNVVTGVFCQSAFEGAQQDLDLTIEAQLKEKQTYVDRLKMLFQEMHCDPNYQSESSGLTAAELHAQLARPKVKAWFKALPSARDRPGLPSGRPATRDAGRPTTRDGVALPPPLDGRRTAGRFAESAASRPATRDDARSAAASHHRLFGLEGMRPSTRDERRLQRMIEGRGGQQRARPGSREDWARALAGGGGRRRAAPSNEGRRLRRVAPQAGGEARPPGRGRAAGQGRQKACLPAAHGRGGASGRAGGAVGQPRLSVQRRVKDRGGPSLASVGSCRAAGDPASAADDSARGPPGAHPRARPGAPRRDRAVRGRA